MFDMIMFGDNYTCMYDVVCIILSFFCSIIQYMRLWNRKGSLEDRNEKINKGLTDGSLEKGVYRGLGGYKLFDDSVWTVFKRFCQFHI